MATNHVQPGEVITFTAAAAIASGAGVLIGVRLGVSLSTLAIGETGSAAVWGVWSLPKLSTDTMAQGALVYWDNTNKRLTTTASGNTLAGYAFEAAGSGATSVSVKLNA